MKKLLLMLFLLPVIAYSQEDPMYRTLEKDNPAKELTKEGSNTTTENSAPDEMNELKLDLETDISDLQKQLNLLNKQSSENEEVQEMKGQIEENIQDLQRQLDQVNYQIQQQLLSDSLQPQQTFAGNTAGMELQQGAKMQFVVIGVTLSGALISGVLVNQSLGTGIAVAGITGVIGFVLNISAWSHINKAGKIMDGERLSFNGNRFTYKLNR